MHCRSGTDGSANTVAKYMPVQILGLQILGLQLQPMGNTSANARVTCPWRCGIANTVANTDAANATFSKC